MSSLTTACLASAGIAVAAIAAYHFTIGPGGGASADLDREFHAFRAEVRSAPKSGAPPAASATPVSEDEVAHLRALLTEVHAREAHERDVESVRRMVKAAGLALAKDLEDRVCELGSGLSARIRASAAERSQAKSKEEQAAVDARLETSKKEFEADLRALIPAEDADKLLLRFPPKGFERRLGPGGTTGPGPAMAK